jgi:hypothetical protein
LSFGATLQPFYGAYGAYSPDPSNPSKGLEMAKFNSSFGRSIPEFLSFAHFSLGAECLAPLFSERE